MGDHFKPSMKQAVGVEKGLKKISETWLPFLESSRLFMLPGAAPLQEKAIAEFKAPGEPGWTRTDHQDLGRQTDFHRILHGRCHV